MDATRPSLELVPIEGDPAKPSAPAAPTPELVVDSIEIGPAERPIPIGGGEIAKHNPYAAQAAREYAEGHVDQTLWDRALAQSNGDKTAAAAIYVRGRATALRLFDRHDKRPGARLRGTPAPDIALVGRDSRPVVIRATFWEQYRYAIIAGAVALPIAIGAAMLSLNRTPASDTAAPSPAAAARPARAAVAPVAADKAEPLAKAPGPDLAGKVQELRDIGNWNVMVLYAVEWTRKEPANAAAWEALRAGYMQLRQYDDALAAATKAVQLAPDEQRYWRYLGQVNMEIDDQAAALAAFEQASARNSLDIDSLQQMGLIHTRLGHPQDAKSAFDRALAASPGDAITNCLRNGIAQMPPAKEAYAVARQIKAIDARCHGRGDAVASK